MQQRAVPASVSASAGPLHASAGVPQRIDRLDLIRGVATLGILIMNSVAFGLDDAAYSNLEQGGNSTLLDTAIGVLARVFVDQKMMALFSLLFGVGIVIFADRAEAKGRRPVLLSMWRNLLLFAIGIAHTIFWDGDILTVYAVCAPFVLLARKLPAAVLLVAGTAVANLGAIGFLLANDGTTDADLGNAWFSGGSDVVGELSGGLEGLLLLDGFGRALGLMLVGVGLFRLRVVQGTRSEVEYRRLVIGGLAIGLPLSIAGLIVHTSTDWAGSSALLGYGISTLGTVPIAIAYVSIIILWAQRVHPLHDRLRAVGRMALTNYLTQTLIGLLVLTFAFDDAGLDRMTILAVVVLVWAAQLAWSPWWIERFRFGPVEWLWRTATYRSRQPFRR